MEPNLAGMVLGKESHWTNEVDPQWGKVIIGPKTFSSQETAIEMLQYLLCSIIIICRLKFLYKQKSRGLWGPNSGCTKFNIGKIKKRKIFLRTYY